MTHVQTVAALVARVSALYQIANVPEIVDAATASKAADELSFEAQHSEPVRLAAHAARRVAWGEKYHPEAREFAEAAAKALAPVLVVVGLRSGDAADSTAAVCVDLDRGLVTSGEEWAALVRVDRVAELLEQTRAFIVRGPEVWAGEPFGDGQAGTVQRGEDGAVTGLGLNAKGLEASGS